MFSVDIFDKRKNTSASHTEEKKLKSLVEMQPCIDMCTSLYVLHDVSLLPS